mmetsp:Transcript_15250/g.18559  ORF Transcript_15250/g.18559 Transcript_15250/m.18559 type:complete len:94 (+) Transcript_15250:1344-1625(+)
MGVTVKLLVAASTTGLAILSPCFDEVWAAILLFFPIEKALLKGKKQMQRDVNADEVILIVTVKNCQYYIRCRCETKRSTERNSLVRACSIYDL